MSWTNPRTWVAAETVTADEMNTHVRDNFKAIGDAWTAYTPTYSGITIGNATVTAKYSQAGKKVSGYVKIVFGSTSSFSGGFTVSLPTTAATPFVSIGSAVLFDDSASANYAAIVVPQTGGTAVAFTEGGGAGAISDSVPFTWAQDDILGFSFTYEAT